MKKTNNFTSSSFHGVSFKATPEKLIEVLGMPQEHYNDGEDKVNMCWDCETEDGFIITIYDWKEYRPLGMFEEIEWHIGGQNKHETFKAKSELLKQIKNTL